jgi:hypothetical protein
VSEATGTVCYLGVPVEGMRERFDVVKSFGFVPASNSAKGIIPQRHEQVLSRFMYETTTQQPWWMEKG